MRKSVFLSVAILLALFVSVRTFGQTLPAGFSISDIGGAWNQPVGNLFYNGGQQLVVWEKGGRIYVCNWNGTSYVKQSTPVLDISTEVGDWGSHGFLGVALDPGFASNGLIYTLYVVDRRFLLNDNSIPADEGFKATIGRVTRYRINGVGTGTWSADLSSRTILIGETKETGIPILHDSHGIGTLLFASDGTLLVTAGDGADYINVDAGSDPLSYYADGLADGIIRPQENVGSFRSQMLNSHNGKILRIDPATGDGVSSNPFYDATQPRSPKSRVWTLGLRNPFRISIKPGTGSTNPMAADIGEIYVGDVGWEFFEEINVINAPGLNCGWPIYEGLQPSEAEFGKYADHNVANLDEPNPLFGTGGCNQQYFTFYDLLKEETADGITTIYNPCNSSAPIAGSSTSKRFSHHRPIIDYQHGWDNAKVPIFNGNTAASAQIGTPESGVVGTVFQGNCSVGGVVYTGDKFPAEYKNTFLAGDLGGNWIKRITVDYTDVVTRVDNFASGFGDLVCITENPLDGTLFCVDLLANRVKRITFGGNQPPIVKLGSDKTFGPSALTVAFNSSGSADPEGNNLSYSWNFGDPSSGANNTSTLANPTHTFTTAGSAPTKYVVTLTINDNATPTAATAIDSIIISVNNTPPVVSITSPVKNSTYQPGGDTLYTYTATVSDAQHGPADLTYEWQTILRHNNHQHPGPIDNNVNTSARLSRPGCNGDEYYWLIELTVTDKAGLSTKDSAKIFPNCSTVDNTPPTVSSVSPLSGSTGVSTGANIIANFSEAVNASTVTTTTFQLRDAGNNLIPATVSTSGNQITLDPTSSLTGSTVYTATITGGASGVKDLAGNALVSNYSWSFTTAAAGGGGISYTVFQPENFPAAPSNNDGQSIELGMKFRSTQDGFITGIRYYKGAGTTGTHTGSLWSSTGTRLAQVTFTNETASGWQQALFSNPVAITAGVTYVASYFSPSGDFAVTLPYFTQAVVNGPLRGLAYGEDGPNGLYLYTAASAFPSNYHQTSNYWVDVVFTGSVTDNTPPTVSSVSPLSGATGVSTGANIIANFSEAVNASTVTTTTFQLRDAGNNLITATVSTSGNQITLDPSSTLAGSTVYTATITGGASGVKDLADNALVSNYSWSFTTAAVDNTAPTVTSVSPLNGATGVSTGANIIANFSEAVNASTVTTTTFQLRDAGNNLITATVSTSGNQITLDPTSSLTGSTVYTATITGGASGVKDLAGNALVSNYSWSFTTAAAGSAPFTIFQSTDIPAVPRGNDGQSIELGMKFRSTQDGFITGIRYYKGAGTTGTHTGSLWSSTGTRLAQVIFTNETASGWQQALFSNPVAITAGVTYVASYFSPSGDFAVTLPYFTQAVVNGPLRGLAYGEDGPNGLYLYTAASAFPTNFNQSSNYWVDVVFTGSVTDNTPPTVSSVSPLSGATGVSTGANIIANFSEAVNASTVTTTTFQLRDAGNNLITATVSTSGNQVTLDPSSTLAGSTVYTATITGGASGVKDLAGNALVSNYSWSFTTAAVDNTAPTVTSVSPLNGATGVSTGANIIANFSETVNASTVTTTTFQLRDAGNNLIPATVSTSGSQITLDPSSSLTGSTVYTATITGGASGVKDLAGNALVSNYSWSFTTGAVTVQPVTIQSFDTKTGTAATAHSLTGVPAGALLVLATTADAVPSNCAVSSSPALTWTKRVDAAADQSDNAEIWTAVYTAGGAITVTSNWGANNSQVSVCYIVLNAEATLGGASAIGTLQSAPSVTITTTRENSMIFGCTADWRAINGATRTLRDGATERLYYRDGNYTTYHYTKAAATIGSYTEGVSVPTGQQASTALLEIRGVNSGPDVTPPTVTSVSPLSGATGVSTGGNIIANFSESVNASTVTTTTFQLRDAGNNLITSTVSTSGNQVTLDPSSTLAGSTVYTATITGGASGVKDLAGNALVSNYSWSFTTAAVDNTAPTVTSVSPLNGATGVSTGANIIANFSESVNASTVTTTTFQLRDAGNNLITATVSTSGNQITLDPTSSLTASTVYTATITGGASGVKDLAGNALVSNYSWSFTTGAVTVQPVTIQSFDTKTGTAATAHSLTGVPAGALLVLATTADAVPSNCAVSSSPALTWTKRVDAAADQSDNAEIWTAVYTAGGAITVTSNWGANNSQTSVCYIVLNAEATLGGAFAIGTLQSAPSVTITTTRENSIIFGCTADWRAINGATRTLRDGATERLYFKDGHYTTYHYTKAAATIGSYTEGVSVPTGQQASTALLEIRGAAVLTRPAITRISNSVPVVYNYNLGQNFPNPFEQSTVIPFTLSRTERVNLVLYDINGRVVKVLLNASKDAGKHVINFNAGLLSKGIYYYKIQAGNFTDVKKLIIW